MDKNKVLLGMSGGTDSSVAAILLQEQGYEVTGVTFRFYEIDGNTAYLDDASALAVPDEMSGVEPAGRPLEPSSTQSMSLSKPFWLWVDDQTSFMSSTVTMSSVYSPR